MRFLEDPVVAQIVIAGCLASCILFAILQLIYRLWLHPLAKYPGPLLARITNLYSAYHAWRGDIHRDIHLKYG
ncbi:benzoate 4-monooxygenase cytochrome P450 [Colletotrichum tofieldiae]|uniref:Benzoate 4-monooxygenase cytochrome P450 n=1 Tax=Colletotrichum tofieldiae TaxID=708197 RepID=A0A166Q9Z9_9PEZI|nr:benzoate 4-monooxygenase cytochrome P450 [Colletotrichum tofieldiae]